LTPTTTPEPMSALRSQEPPRRPSLAQRSAIREILAKATDELFVLFAHDRLLEASWISAYAKASGCRTRLMRFPMGSPQKIEQSVRRIAGGGATVIVIADLNLNLPQPTIHLAGTEHLSPLDLWDSPAATAAMADACLARLGSDITIRCGEHVLHADIEKYGRGPIPGTVDVEVTKATGTFIADSSIAINRPVRGDARLIGRAVTVTADDGYLVSIACPDQAMQHFLSRAVHVHGARRIATVRLGLRPVAGGPSAIAGPINLARRGVSVVISVAPHQVYNLASADLHISLTAETEDWS
jgi:hypothetical protein